MYDNENIFAKIIKGQIPCKKIYEDDDVLFFEDINPVAKVHVLGVPKVKCVDFSDFVYNNNKDKVDNFFKKINVVIESLGIKNSGYRIITNSGSDGGQEVPHFHVHILGGEKMGPKIK
jgi:histidine triad (HIT) family protein